MSEPEFPEQGMSFIEFVQHIIPDLTHEEAREVLWECTPFPLAQGRDDLLPHLVAVRDQLISGMSLGEVQAQIYRKMDEEMALVAAEDAEPRTITQDWDLPEHVKSRPTVDVETDLL
jgi:hypothetical protein